MDENRKRIYNTINYVFNDEGILKEALSPPYANKQASENAMIEFKRLKWLGDSILDMVVTDMLYKSFPEDSEGNLSKKKGRLVAANTLHEVAKLIRIQDFIYHDQNGNTIPSNRSISDTIEAIIGAIYVDGGIENATRFISKYWESLMKNNIVNLKGSECNPKTYLIEWSHKNKLSLPKYEIINTFGPAHSPTYKVKAHVERVGEAFGTGNTIREAEKKAAKVLYDTFFSQLENIKME